ncbi:MAG: hypothetical protein ACYDA1_00230 [Vulcanimicrobiaceae bacterium]
MRVLFVSNGNGEAAIVERLAKDVTSLHPGIQCEHVALVGIPPEHVSTIPVGPQRRMPSGGLIAMGNIGNIVRDLRAGLVGLTVAQLRFLRKSRGRYVIVVAVGDTYALLMALQARSPTIYVGTAKSVYVAPYGPGERSILRKAERVFVRDGATAADLLAKGVVCESPGNIIADLYAPDDADPPFYGTPRILMLPGSRDDAYARSVDLVQIVQRVAPSEPNLSGVLSLAPGLSPERFADALAGAGCTVVRDNTDPNIPFHLALSSSSVITAWCGPLGAAIARTSIVFGQAGTANEAAAAAGVPILAYDSDDHGWYRTRQRGLLGDAVAILSGSYDQAAEKMECILRDSPQRERMSQIGRQRMGGRGASKVIAHRIVEMAQR